jgi:predicted acylesterase/phospholipase RssA
LTFEEAYKKTGRTFCITLSSTTKKAPPVLLNYISAPNVTIASAVIASAAVPGFVPPVRLQYKDANGVVRIQQGIKDETYFDGSIEQDIPINGLAEMLNCHFFVACQANPHVVPFFFDSKGGVGRPSRWSSGGQDCSWRGGFLLASLEMYLKVDMKAKCRFLNDIEAAVGFTSTMMIQEFVGSTTIVPQVQFADYFRVSV